MWKHTKRGPSVLAEEASDVVGDTLGTSEDKDLVGAGLHDLLHVLDHALAFLEVGHDLDDLRNAVVSRQVHRTDVDLDVIIEEVRRQLANLLGPGSGPHASLTVGTNLANDLTNLGLETHVQHAVSLVKDEVGNTTKVSAASLQHINQTTRSGNADLNTTGQIADLRALGNTTVDTGVANARGLAELCDLSLNLDSQFTGRSQDQDDGAVARCEERLGIDVDDSGKTVGQSLSGAGLGNTDDVATRESHGPTLRLNCSGAVEALSLDLRQNVLRETGLVEGLDRARNIMALDGHLVLLAEIFDFALRAGSDIGVLLVEGLFELGKSAQI